MKYFEFGQGNPELMVMLPGGGVCYRGAIPIAEEMAKVYHVVLVAYDGFYPDEPGTEYKSRTRQSGSATMRWNAAAERSTFSTAFPMALLCSWMCLQTGA